MATEKQPCHSMTIYEALQATGDAAFVNEVKTEHEHMVENTFPRPLLSDHGSISSDEQLHTTLSGSSNTTVEFVPQHCFSAIMNPECQYAWASQRLKIADSPYEYVLTLPSKGIREKFIDALNVWFQAPEEKTNAIKEVIAMLHDSSLIIDDFQDNSPLRRGKPSTHTVFGPAQAINSATYIIIKAISKIQAFTDPTSLAELTDMILAIFEGQAMDLSWTFNNTAPSVEEYLLMVNDKTGALFRLAGRLLRIYSKKDLGENAAGSINKIVSLLGQYFQIRDDYMNLVDTKYTDQKGFCEDLDEGKYSLPLLHALQHDSTGILTSMLSMRRTQGRLTVQQKVLMLERMEACGSLGWTKSLLGDLDGQILAEIGNLEGETGTGKTTLRRLVELLKLDS
ncbi:geranylgeranyl pyrophosphate synthetase [Neonectria magnoliae]|uniref:Geranylgeranyl pyrophosphate synthetase n=1 Tax=Neonectria magnoliae TaxID=2732573 RepID=A0ABR1H861_9HYPO